MILISHRGNLNGPDPSKENKPSYITNAIRTGFQVEVDFWFIDNKFGVSVRLSQVLCGESNKLPKFAFQGLENNDDEYVEEIMNDLIDE